MSRFFQRISHFYGIIKQKKKIIIMIYNHKKKQHQTRKLYKYTLIQIMHTDVTLKVHSSLFWVFNIFFFFVFLFEYIYTYLKSYIHTYKTTFFFVNDMRICFRLTRILYIFIKYHLYTLEDGDKYYVNYSFYFVFLF